MTKTSILDTGKLQDFAKERKLQPFRVKQIYQEIFKNQNIDFADMTTLSKDLRDDLEKDFSVVTLKADKIIEDKFTTKIGFQTQDGCMIEAVIIYHWQNEKHNINDQEKLNRITLCISSQVGCAMGCIFCVTGKLGFKRNLTRDEMVSQILFANNFIKKKLGKQEDGSLHGVRNIVFMGMGEPLLNYDNVKKSIEIMLRQEAGFSLSKRHITISTCGIVPGIRKLIKDGITVKLAISLHAPNQVLRDKLMPIAKAYPLDELTKVIGEYVKATDNRVFYEYIMIRNMTDTPEVARQLVTLLRKKLAHVNLIPYNTNPAIQLEESDVKTIQNFKRILEEGGLTVTVRDNMGRKMKGACGQLGYEKIMKDKEEE
ncbi:MAG: 23S rRNA (adenine(2503)-C(2))-methyltransferase RlmN [candidate division SR1 bacterium]|nr:23S rRNA (adenine(2503)-C(2))-methyltransferase RlmN [candidate division SR1 bacterium]